AEQGWGTLSAHKLGDAVLALDSTEWAEAADEGRGEFPSCHITCGLLAEFLVRVAEGLVAVMEVECRSRGDARCRFLAGAPETLSTLYERMAQGSSYGEALGIGRRPAPGLPPLATISRARASPGPRRFWLGALAPIH